MHTPGNLYLVPAPLDFGCTEQAAITDVMPAGTLQVAARLDHWICENAKSTRAYLKRIHDIIPLATALQAQKIMELPHHIHKKGDHQGRNADAEEWLTPALKGHNIGLVSEAGMPAIADPGASVVRAAHRLGLNVVPLVGPVSLMLALAASGMNGQSFAFVGYLPQQVDGRTRRISELQALAIRTGQTQLFIETPYRNAQLFSVLLATLAPDTVLALCIGLTLASASVKSSSAEVWRKSPVPGNLDRPAIFAIGRG